MYVGSTTQSFAARWWKHKRDLNKNVHKNDHLQNSVNKYGITNFEFDVLHECEPEFCLSFEQYWRNMLRTHEREFGYDICYVAGNTIGYKFDEEGKIKLSLIRRGRKPTPEALKNMSLARLGKKRKPFSDEWKNNISLGISGANNWFFGRFGDKHPMFGKLLEKSPRAKIVLQFDINNNFIKEWSCAKLAADELGLHRSGICVTCKGKTLTCGGFIWKYKENKE